MTRLRQARLSDIPQLCSFITETTSERDNLEKRLQTLVQDSSGVLVIAVENGRIVGSTGASFDTEWVESFFIENEEWFDFVNGEAVAFVCYGAVHPSWRGQGLASRLLRRTEQVVRPRARVVVGLAWLHEGDTNGGHVLESNGYTLVEQIEAYWDSHVEEPLSCKYCGTHCKCDAAIYVKHVGTP